MSKNTDQPKICKNPHCFEETCKGECLECEPVKRPYIKNIQNMITVCLTSVIKQMSKEDKIVLFLDGEDSNNVLDTVCSNVSYTINQYKDIGAAEINNKCIEYINEKVLDKNEIIYLCEDDYLHYSNCLSQMKDFFNMYPDYFCHPTDYPNIYKEKDFKQTSEIIVTKNCHWRSIKSTTYTFAFKKHLFDKWLNHSVFTNINNNLFGCMFSDNHVKICVSDGLLKCKISLTKSLSFSLR